MSISKFVLFAALSAMAASASAVTETSATFWGEHARTEVGSNSIDAESFDQFDDVFNFTLSATDTGLKDYAFTADINSTTNLAGSTITLYKLEGTAYLSQGSFSFDGLDGSSHDFGSFGAGSYYYEVTGRLANGADNGSYTFFSVANPVPEPATTSLLLAGLGMIGFAASRRRVR